MKNKNQEIRKRSSYGGYPASNMNINGFGVDIHDRPTEYYGYISVGAIDENLISLEIYEGTEDVHCNRNNLTSLVLPNSVVTLVCDPELFNYDECKVKNVTIFYER
jgi:hypothetical protein